MLLGIVNDCNPESLNKLSLRSVNLLDNIIFNKELQESNALSPIVVILFGKEILLI